MIVYLSIEISMCIIRSGLRIASSPVSIGKWIFPEENHV